MIYRMFYVQQFSIYYGESRPPILAGVTVFQAIRNSLPPIGHESNIIHP